MGFGNQSGVSDGNGMGDGETAGGGTHQHGFRSSLGLQAFGDLHGGTDGGAERKGHGVDDGRTVGCVG